LELVAAVTLLLACPVLADEPPAIVSISDPIVRAGGRMVLCRKTPAESPDAVLVHFHGDPATLGKAFARSRISGVLVVVNFPGLSSAYSKPLAEDPLLFDQILTRAWRETHGDGEPRWEAITVSSFSAGYGAVREVLKSDASLERIDAIIAADSIYAGLDDGAPIRAVDPQHMRDFLRYARLAAEGKKRFVVSHSTQATSYASTTETADYLLQELGLDRTPREATPREGLRQTSAAGRGGFKVLGFAGDTGADHMRHLREIDVLWDIGAE
jgi:hypothetical protein